MFVIRTKENRNQIALAVFQIQKKIRQPVQPSDKPVMVFTSGKNGAYHMVLRAIPSRSSGDNIVAVPANGIDATQLVCFTNIAF